MKITFKKTVIGTEKWYWEIGGIESGLYARESDCKRGWERHVKAVCKMMGVKLNDGWEILLAGCYEVKK